MVKKTKRKDLKKGSEIVGERGNSQRIL